MGVRKSSSGEGETFNYLARRRSRAEDFSPSLLVRLGATEVDVPRARSQVEGVIVGEKNHEDNVHTHKKKKKSPSFVCPDHSAP